METRPTGLSTDTTRGDRDRYANCEQLAANNFASAKDVQDGAGATLRALCNGEMPFAAGSKLASIMSVQLRAMEMRVKYGPFME